MARFHLKPGSPQGFFLLTSVEVRQQISSLEILMRPGVALTTRGAETLLDRPYCSPWPWLQCLWAHLIRKVISSFTNHNLRRRARTASQLGAQTQTSVCWEAAQQGADGKQSNLLQLSVFKRLRGRGEGGSAPDGCLQVRRPCVGLGYGGEEGFRQSLTGLPPVGVLTGLTGVLVNWWKLWIAPIFFGIILKCQFCLVQRSNSTEEC